jgi:acyl carrier protein
MNADDWMNHVRAAIAEETGISGETITRDTTAADVEGWDSLAHVRIMLNIEARAGQSVDIDASYGASTVGELIDILII